MNNPYWVTFHDRSSACIDKAESPEHALKLAYHFGNPIEAKVLPYPANPRLTMHSSTPSLCFKPHECVGHTACPRRISCTE